MAPEQAKGKAVDKRADVWAFGCVLWEMLTGSSLFGRDTMSETIAAVIKDAPPLDALPPEIPGAVRRLLERCLERDPRMRLRDIGEARILLSRPADEALVAGRAHLGTRVVAVAILAAMALATITGVVAWRAAPRTLLPVRRLDLGAAVAGASRWALSPDGTRVAYVAQGHLYVRRLASIDSQDLGQMSASSENLFWSPDSGTIAFDAEGSVQTVPATGGTVFTVCKIPTSGRLMDARWLKDGTMVFPVWRDGIYKVSAAGGTPSLLVPIDPAREVDFHAVSPLPDGRLIVLAHEKGDDADVIDLFDGRTRSRLSSDQVHEIEYVEPGILLLLRVGTNPGVWAVPFGGATLDMTRGTLLQAGASDFSVARDGTILLKLPAHLESSLAWVDRERNMTPISGPPITGLGNLALSPDGTRAAYVIGTGPAANLIIRDVRSGEDTPLTFNKAEDTFTEWSSIGRPSWFPRGDRILYDAGKIASTTVVAQRADAAEQPRVLTQGTGAKVSSDGRTLLFRVDDRGRYLLRKMPLGPEGAAGTAAPVFPDNPEPSVLEFDLSPDGRLLAYAARQADGSTSLFLTEFPAATSRWLVTLRGRYPQFSHDGREVLFVRGRRDDEGRTVGELATTTVDEGPPLKLSPPVRLFDDAGSPAPNLNVLSVSPDRRRFLTAIPLAPRPENGPRLLVLQNWPALLKQ